MNAQEMRAAFAAVESRGAVQTMTPKYTMVDWLREANLNYKQRQQRVKRTSAPTAQAVAASAEIDSTPVGLVRRKLV